MHRGDRQKNHTAIILLLAASTYSSGTPEVEGTAPRHLAFQKGGAAPQPEPGATPTGPAGSPELGGAGPLRLALGTLRPQRSHPARGQLPGCARFRQCHRPRRRYYSGAFPHRRAARRERPVPHQRPPLPPHRDTRGAAAAPQRPPRKPAQRRGQTEGPQPPPRHPPPPLPQREEFPGSRDDAPAAPGKHRHPETGGYHDKPLLPPALPPRHPPASAGTAPTPRSQPPRPERPHVSSRLATAAATRHKRGAGLARAAVARYKRSRRE